MSEEKIRDGYFKIRPAGRHIITIGKDLIKDKYAAIVELVKNSYDADASYCKISLLPFIKKVGGKEDQKGIRVVILDDGHGMDYTTVVEKWMVPSTDDKFNRKISPAGRVMQGRKGVGRYAASMIGEDLVLQTVDTKHDLTTLYLIWEDFENAKYLEDVNVLIENFSTERESGTEVIIVGNETNLNEWNTKQIQNLKFELKKLIPPVDKTQDEDYSEIENFKIEISLGDFPFLGFSNTTEIIEPYPVFELYDYKITGTVSDTGIANLSFQNTRIKGSPAEQIPEFKIHLNTNETRKNDEAYCGKIKVDFRVFDRDSDSIDNLIQRGLKDPTTDEYVGRREARVILNLFSGIGVYRNGFRIRPLGDAGYDWLELDNDRVQNPSLRIGSDQVIGFIHIESEERSRLEEKSARDGLKESPEYFGLREISKQILKQLENRRFIYRKNVGLGRNSRNINDKINVLFDFKELKDRLNIELEKLNIDAGNRKKITQIVTDKETQNNQIANELKQSIALYQGQATIGKIVNIILHEGRKPLSYFKNQIPVISEWADELNLTFDQSLLEKIIKRLGVVNEQSTIFIKLFDKLDPLSAKKRVNKKDFSIRKVIEDVEAVFSSEIIAQNITYTIDCDKSQTLLGWQEDFYVVFTNLVDNSLYWLQEVKDRPKTISFKVYKEDNITFIDYKDNGPGIEKEFIESEIIFEPEFSNKTGGGIGLGLAISGEAINRNGGKLKVIYSDKGAFFRIEI